MKIAIVGAGFSGSVIARELAEAGHMVNVFDKRNHVAGNCHTERNLSGIMVHRYGPHIFHTDNKEVWNYINKWDTIMPYINRVKTVSNNKVYSLPINLHTINQFFDKTFNPKEAEDFIKTKVVKIPNPKNFEEQALSMVGPELYEAFLKGYTTKQWGINPKEIPAYVLKRLPLRFNYNDNYYNHKYQGIPLNGYTYIVEKILNHLNIKTHLGIEFNPDELGEWDYVFWSGPVDHFFKYKFGKLNYRTLDFEEVNANGDFQGNAVINYSDINIPHTRITEYKHFTPWEDNDKTTYHIETSRECEAGDIPYYPMNLKQDIEILKSYNQEIQRLENVSFIGRLGTYQYMDMDVVIKHSLQLAKEWKSKYI